MEHGYVTIGYVVDGALVIGGGSVVEGNTEDEEGGREGELLLLGDAALLVSMTEGMLETVSVGVLPVEVLDGCVVPGPVVGGPLPLEGPVGREHACRFSTCRFSRTSSISSRFTLSAFHSQSIDHWSSAAPSPPSP